MNVTIDQLLAKIGQLTVLLDGANAWIAELEAQLAGPGAGQEEP